MEFKSIPLKDTLVIHNIYTIHYFEYASDFTFSGESHDFWEFICVDKGEVNVTGGDRHVLLKKGDIAFHMPGEFHDVNATGSIAPNLVVMSFDCNDPAMDFFREKVLHIDDVERTLLANVILEARNCFSSSLHQLPTLKENPPFGSEQLIKLYITQFLIHILRRYQNPVVIQKSLANNNLLKTTKNNQDQLLFHRLTDYLENHLHTQLTIEQICKDNLLGRSHLQKIFKDQTGQGVMEHFFDLKIKAAKVMIRRKNMNFTQIAESLGYSSIHYFSRQFKKTTGMTPSEYASSIKVIADDA